MTLNELKNDVARLGFESYVEDEECFIASANRALALIYIDRPVSKTVTLSLRGPRTSFVRELIEHTSDEEISFNVTGKSLSFRSSGVGSCTVEDNTGSSFIPLTQDGQLTKKLIYGPARITFTGEYYFTVSNLALFKDLVGAGVTDIPEYSPFRELRPEDYCDDFRAFASHPTDKDGQAYDEVKLIDGRIRAPFDFRGELYLTYYRTPRKIDAESPNAEIDISGECAPMLPLLTASFLWLDDDPSKAQYYMSLYRDMAANTKRYSNNKLDAAYSVNGWA